jgi:hypothetical protein
MNSMKWFSQALLVTVLSSLMIVPQDAFAQQHVVTSSDLRQAVVNASQTRQAQEAQLENFFSSDQARQALRSANIDYKVVQNGIHLLSNDELARLSARADQAQRDFAAGTMTDRDLLWIVIALALLLIIVVVATH